MSMNSFPKLDDQDDYLISLQNNNYSQQTIVNYARDLCIFAVFLHFRNVKFMDVSKKDISNFKGYLIAGQHLEDLDKIREQCKENVDVARINNTEALRGSTRPLKNLSGVSSPRDNQENESGRGKRFESDFLSKIYSKVYGGLGVLGTPRNKAGRKNDGLDPNSINRMLSALRSFLKFRIAWDLPIPLPPDAIDMMKSEKRLKKVASKDELVSLIESPMEFERDEKIAIRNRCMLEMLFATGMRISELIGLDLDQINSEGKMYIWGKGKKERTVFMTPRSLDWLNSYLKVRLEFAFTDRGSDEENLLVEGLNNNSSNEERSNLNLEMFDKGNRKYIKLIESYRESGYLEKFDSPALFIPFSGSRAKKPNARISTNHFQEKIAEYRRKLGIQIPTSAHSLRHGFATYLAEEGASPVALQVLLGHSSLNTTTKYVHASEKFAEETVRKSHPLQ